MDTNIITQDTYTFQLISDFAKTIPTPHAQHDNWVGYTYHLCGPMSDPNIAVNLICTACGQHYCPACDLELVDD